jgi:uncharacterized repeat protein (TIGR01451 family)
MTFKFKHLVGASAFAIAALAATPAMATGTDAGTTISNTATLNYKVGGVSQTAVNATNNIIVDRKIILTVVEANSTFTTVVPGQNGTTNFYDAAATTFTITNNSNTTIDVGLTAANLASSTSLFSNTDNFDAGAYTYYRDNGNGVLDASDTLITYLDELAEDASATVHVVTNIDIARVNADYAVVSLTGQAREGGTASTQGIVIANTSGANTALMDTVFADAQGTDDAATPDGKHSARDAYKVSAPVLTLAKLSRVIEDPINVSVDGGVTPNANAKMIPGATVEYCITVANAAAGAAATNVVISDILPTQTTYLSAFGVREGGTVASGVCSGGTNTGTQASGTVTGNLGTVSPSTTKTVFFRVTIN